MAIIKYQGYWTFQDFEDNNLIKIYKKKRQVYELPYDGCASEEDLQKITDDYIAYANSGIFGPLLDAKYGVRKRS